MIEIATNSLDLRLTVPVEFLTESKRPAFIAGAKAMRNEIIAALTAISDAEKGKGELK